jgi:protoporphyrin/coproporphyrin ferrochelatase
MQTKKMRLQKNILVILMTYGSPKTLKDVPQYLKNVYGGKDASQENIKEFQRRYKIIGGSPLVKITKNQAKALEKELNENANGETFTAVAGMRFSDPFIDDVIQKKSKKIDKIIGIIMSPQYSPIIMKGYIKELNEAVQKLKNEKIELTVATDWHAEPYLIKAFAEKITEALGKFPPKVRDQILVLFSAHSMPKRVIEKEPDYINDLKDTAAKVARAAKLPKKRWMFCYQSAGHTPEEWLKPDFADIMPELKEKRQKYVLIAPVQFLADHLEILYDVGIGAREQAEENGITFARTESLNTSPLFIKALASVVNKTLKKSN